MPQGHLGELRNFLGVGVGGMVQIPGQEFNYFCNRDMEVIMPAASLSKKCRDVVKFVVRCDRPLKQTPTPRPGSFLSTR